MTQAAPLVAPTLAMRKALAQALQARLDSLGGAIGVDPVAFPTPCATEEAEEQLRRVSVPLRASLRQAKLSESQRAELISTLTSLALLARWDDVRYLDVYNVVFESWPEGYLPELRHEFLALYRAVLSRVLSFE